MNLADAANICTIASLLISVFVAFKVVTLEQKISQSGNNNKSLNQSAKGDGNTLHGKQ